MADRRPPVSELSCYCRCHIDEQEGQNGVLRTDPIAAAASCEVCRFAHTKSLEGRPPELDARRDPPPRDPTAWKDPE